MSLLKPQAFQQTSRIEGREMGTREAKRLKNSHEKIKQVCPDGLAGRLPLVPGG
jgi:hypothetical protein